MAALCDLYICCQHSVFAYQYGRKKSLCLLYLGSLLCPRLGFLETDPEMQNQGRKLMGNSSQEIQLQRRGRQDWAGVDLQSSYN